MKQSKLTLKFYRFPENGLSTLLEEWIKDSILMIDRTIKLKIINASFLTMEKFPTLLMLLENKFHNKMTVLPTKIELYRRLLSTRFFEHHSENYPASYYQFKMLVKHYYDNEKHVSCYSNTSSQIIQDSPGNSNQ